MKNKTEIMAGRVINVSDESLEEFKKLFLRKYDYQLNDEQAREQALKLLNLVNILLNVMVENMLRKQEGSDDV